MYPASIWDRPAVEPEDVYEVIRKAGPIFRYAVPFLFASPEATDHVTYHQTDAIRYCRQSDSGVIFITHVRWKEGDIQHELSRCKIIDVWLHAFNLTERMYLTCERILDTWELTPDGERLEDEHDRIRFEKMYDADVKKIQELHLYMSDFLAMLGTHESTGIPRQHWDLSDVPVNSFDLSAHYDPALPAITQPFLIIRSLLRLITSANSGDLPDFMVRLNYPLTDIIAPYRGEWRSKVKAMDRDISDTTILDFGDERSAYLGTCRNWGQPIDSLLPVPPTQANLTVSAEESKGRNEPDEEEKVYGRMDPDTDDRQPLLAPYPSDSVAVSGLPSFYRRALRCIR